MLSLYNYFRQYPSEGRLAGEPIKDYKGFYRSFSNSREFGGDGYGHLDHLRKARFFEYYGELIDVLLSHLPSSLLDIGCGAGVNIPVGMFVSSFCEYTGLDYAENSLSHAKSVYPGLSFICSDAFDLEPLGQKYDCALLSSLLILYEKYEDRVRLLNQAKRTLSENGFIVAIIWHDSPIFTLSVRLSRFVGKALGVALPADFMGICMTRPEALRMFYGSGLVPFRSKIVGRRFGVLQSASYLCLRKYRRIFGAAERERKPNYYLSKIEDLIAVDRSIPPLLVRILNCLPSALIGHFSIYCLKPASS